LQRANVSPHLVLYWDAFKALSGTRHLGMNGPQALQVSEITAYCNLLGIGRADERFDLFEIVRAMDVIFLDFHSEK